MNRDERIRRTFTALAPGYEASMDRELRGGLGLGYRELVDALIEEAAPDTGEWVLDLATGTAYLARRLAGHVGGKGRIVGLDITPAMLLEARARTASAGLSGAIHLVCGSGMAMPLASDRFDVVLCTYGAHHMDPTALLSELRRVLRPGGRLVMAAAGAPAAWRARPARPLIEMLTASARLLDRHARMQAEVEAFRNIRTSAEWRRLLADSGFVHANVAERRPRRPWYPRDLRIKAQARESEPHRSLNRRIEWRETDK